MALRRPPDAGVGMLEMIPATFVLLFILLGIAEFANFEIAEYVLNRAALKSLRTATGVDGLQFDPRNLAGGNSRSARFAWGLQSAIFNGTRFVDGSGWCSELAEERRCRLRQFEYSDGRRSPVAVILPGQRVWRVRDDGVKEVVEHPSACPPESTSTECRRTLPADEDWQYSLLNEPFEVRIEAEITPIIPQLPSLVVVASVHGFREIPRGQIFAPKPKRREDIEKKQPDEEPQECEAPSIACEESDVPGLQGKCRSWSGWGPSFCSVARTGTCCECQGMPVCPSIP